MGRDPRWVPEGQGKLLYLRLLILAVLFIVVVSLLPDRWKAWVFVVGLVAVLCGSIVAIFLAGRIKPPRRKCRLRPEPQTSDLDDESMKWERQRRY